MRAWLPTRSFRGRFILVLLVAAVLPLALVGAWLTRSIGRAGESLLRSEMHQSIETLRAAMGDRWTYRRADLLLMAQNEAAVRLVASGSRQLSPRDSAYLRQLYASSRGTVERAQYLDSRNHVVLALRDAAVSPDDAHPRSSFPAEPNTITVRLPVRSDPSAESQGELVAEVRVDALVPSDTTLRLPGGAIVQIDDPATHASLLTARVPDSSLARDRFTLGGATWITATSLLTDPPLELIVAAPVGPYVQPFEHTVKLGAMVLAAVALSAVLLTVLFTSRLTASLEALASAADAVAAGDLERRIDRGGTDEVARVAVAFNSMTESLRQTLAELSHRRALAAVGEFTAALSHEVRNALTSIRVDLQLAEERLSPESAARSPIVRALESARRLDSAVTGSLRLARSGRVSRRRVNLHHSLATAAQSAASTFATRGARLALPDPCADPLWIEADPVALEQMFLNLLLNAAEAMPPGTEARITAHASPRMVCVTVADEGAGIPEESLTRSTEPFYSTKPGGTGLGLPIARQIAVAHGGTLSISSVLGRGTRVEIQLPRAD